MKRWLFFILLLSLPVLAQEVLFRDGFENHDPVIVSSPVTSASLGNPYSYDVDATDIDGDTLLYLLTTSPAGMSIDPASGLIGWTPASSGSFDVTVNVSDGNGGSAQQSWSLAVADGPDSDNDGLSDAAEDLLGTDPGDPDSDDDDLKDGDEFFIYLTDPLDDDTDNDKLTDGAEVNTHHTKPLELDTDKDLFGDGLELAYGTDPLDPDDFPAGQPDPEAQAPANDPTTGTNLLDSVEFLFNGAPPLQTGVAEGVIDPLRAAVIRGKVMTRDGAPLPDITISVHEHPELGMTQTRVDGKFDMVVNGGGFVALDYIADGFLPGQRMFRVEQQDWTQAPDVALIPVDVQVTAVDLTAPGMKMAQGSEITDADGTRQATVMFPEGVTAMLKLPGGGEQALNGLAVRATEYTVGDMGPQAMPGLLPAASGYTYAVELSVDEALAAGGQVSFSAPLPTYVENFLNFPVGTIVPAGYYDREKMAWVAAPNGKVIAILGIDGGLAEIDTDGDSIADDPAVLAALGITGAERENLAATYAPGTSLWRVPVEHFTPWDYNWPYGFPTDAITPSPQVRTNSENLQCVSEMPGSIISCQTQVLGERVPVTGTPFTLNYRSNRTPGRSISRQTTIQVTGSSVPDSLEHVELSYSIAGNFYSPEVAVAPNQSLNIDWTGLDGFNRPIQGTAILSGQVRYGYQAVYKEPAEFSSSFGGFGGSVLSSNETRQTVALTTPFKATLQTAWDARAQGLGGWTLDAHHAFDLQGRKLHLGTGVTRSADTLGTVLDRVIPVRDPNQEYETVQGAFAVAADSDIIFLEGTQKIGFRRSADGSIARFIGCDPFVHSPCDMAADGVLATEAAFETAEFAPYGMIALAMGPDDSLYVAGLCYIARVDANGVLHLLGGSFTPECASEAGDGGPATSATFYYIRDIDVASDGSVFVVQNNQVVRRIGPDGVVTRFAGNGTYSYGGDGGQAINASFRNLSRVAVGPEGTVYLADAVNYRIRAVAIDGIIRTVVGNGSPGYSGDGGPAVAAQIGWVGSLAVSPDGRIVFGELDNNPTSCRLRIVDTAGVISLAVGDGSCYISGSWPLDLPTGVLAREAEWGSVSDIDFGPDGEIYVLPPGELWKITRTFPAFGPTLFAVAAADGTELYVFDAQGRHSQTLDALTGGVLFEFGYDGNGWLTSVTDGDGKVTQIERDGSGRPTAIVGPFGQQTDLSTDANGFLSGITNPAGEQLSILSTPGGLVKRTTDPRGRISNYAYDSGGRLVSQSDNAGYSQELVRTDSGADYSITRTSGMGRSITYDVNLASGNVQNQLVTAPDGSTQSTHDDIETGSSTFTSATGMVVSQQLSADPRFSMQSPIPATSLVSAPGGPTFSASSSREALLIDSNDPLSLISTSNAVTIDGRTSNRTYDASSRTEVITHPTGRTETTTIDSLGRATSYQFADLALLTTTYNGLGQLEIVSAGAGPDARTTSYTYAADGYRQTRTNALGRTTSFLHDAAGRLISKSLPGAVTTIFGYNAAGDLDSIVPPGRPEHTFNYTLHGQLASITPPAVTGSGPTVFTYNDDLQLTSITHPGDEVVEVIHDNEGRVQSLALSRGGVPAASYSYTYLVADQIDTIFGPGSQTLSYAYQGGLVTTQAWGGVVEGSVSWAYDNAFRVVSETVAGGASIAFNYDDDDLLTGAGDYAIVRSAVNGLSQSATIGVMQDSWTHNMFGEVESFSAFANAAPIYATSYSRNKLGQITQKVETIEGITDVFDYEYDELDQLIEVRKNNFLVESYAYDDNGNRLSGTINGNQSDGVYDSQDRLLSYGNTTFEYTGAGRLLSRTETGGVVTDYDYDVVGNLLSVTLPDTTEIAYGHDGADRVVQRAVGASISHRFLYEGILPIAKLDEFGNVIGQYVYVGGNAPVYIIKNGSIYRVITDQVRSVRLVVDVSDGSIVQRLDYDSFGNVLLDTNPGFQPFGFAGGLYDPATHLLRFGLRDYDPATGRWVAKDPIGFSGKDTNLYRYVGNDPVNRNDPIGLGPSNPKGFFDFLSKFGRYKEAKAFVDKLLGRINKIGEGVTHIEEINENLDNDKRPPDESARDFFRSAIESCRLVIKTFGGPLGTLVDKYAEIGQTALDVTVEKGNEYFDKGNLQLCAQSEGEICDMW